MLLINITTITESNTTAVSKPPITYFIQSGVVDVAGEFSDGGGSCGAEDGSSGSGGGSGADSSDSTIVVKAPTPLQALKVSELAALTFQ
jgi:hypothetical protein